MSLSDYQLLVFDWDGTLSDSSSRIMQSAQLACQDLHIPEPSIEHLKKYMGHGLDNIVRDLFPSVTQAQMAQLIERYRYYYFLGNSQETLFKNVLSTLSILSERGYLLAVATNKSRKGLTIALKQTGLSSLFLTTKTADECGAKPDPTMLEELIAYSNIPAEKTVMIGDSAVDMQFALNAKVDSVAITHQLEVNETLKSYSPIATLTEMNGLLTLF